MQHKSFLSKKYITMAGTGGGVLGAWLSDDVLMNLGPLTFIVTSVTEGQVLWLTRIYNIWSGASMLSNELEGKRISYRNEYMLYN